VLLWDGRPAAQLQQHASLDRCSCEGRSRAAASVHGLRQQSVQCVCAIMGALPHAAKCPSHAGTAFLHAVTRPSHAGSAVLVVFLLPHNPALRSLPQAARDMTDDSSYRKLERSVRGCTDWYFWHMCSSRAQEERLRAFNLPACDTILSEVRPSLHRCSVLHGAPCHVYAHARLQLRRSRLHMHAQAATRRDAPVSQESE
jgi:hypothetical protein